VRLLVNRAGEARADISVFTPLGRPVRLAIAPGPVDGLNPMLFHKTTHRELYDAARRTCPDADDVLLWNGYGEITESCIANVVVDLDGALYTPPVECGLLPGTYRAMLLRSRKVRERVITLDELKRARHVWVVNSVRGQQLAQLI
jgi:para-aminobenzoate synthetase/4-amino-4-deoxychorismate lyase